MRPICPLVRGGARVVLALVLATGGLLAIWAVARPFQPGADRLVISYDEVGYRAQVVAEVDGRVVRGAPSTGGEAWPEQLTLTPVGPTGAATGPVRFIWDATVLPPPASWTIEDADSTPHVVGVPGIAVPFPVFFDGSPIRTIPFAVGPGYGRVLVEGPGGSQLIDLARPTASGYREVQLDARSFHRGPALVVLDVPVDARSIRLTPTDVAGTVAIASIRLSGSREIAFDLLSDVTLGPGLERAASGRLTVANPAAAYLDLPPLTSAPRLHAGNVRGLSAAFAASLLAILAAFTAARVPLPVPLAVAVVVLVGAAGIAALLYVRSDASDAAAPLALRTTDDAKLVAVGTASGESTTFVMLPDGSMLVGGKGGFGGEADAPIEMIPAGGGDARRIGTVRVCSDAERGLLGLETSADFAIDRTVYAFRTAAAAGCGQGAAPGSSPPNEILRIVLASDLTSIERQDVLATGIPSITGAHNAGGLRLGRDGSLFVSIGENGNGRQARAPGSVLGRLLRIPADRLDGTIPVGELASMTFATGLRNPFRFAVLDDAHLVVNDVGSAPPAAAEEVNVVVQGGDYGWPEVEGASSDPRFTPPIWSYAHGDGCASTTGGAIGPAGTMGVEGVPYVFGDFTCGRLFLLEFDGVRPAALLRIRDGDPKLLPSEFRTTSDGRVLVLGFGGTVYEVRR